MNASTHWLNQLLDHGAQPALTPPQIEHALTFAGFPLESTTPSTFGVLPDHRLDVEVTSNRGDCLSHIGLAREIAAATGRALRAPALTDLASRASGAPVESLVSLASEAGENCPHFMVAVIKGVKIGPSPAWLREALEAIGQRSISNVVDATNYVLHEMGNPSHAFDLGRIAKDAGGRHAVIVRMARAGEKLTLLDGTTRDLKPTDVVVADPSGPISLAGVMGGQSTAVGTGTTDVLLEMATWVPAVVRGTARRLNIRSDASHRYERVVSARTLRQALERLVEVVLSVAGGTLAPGVLSAGLPVPAPVQVPLSHDRCRRKIGLALDAPEIDGALKKVGCLVQPAPGGAMVTVPAHRPDIAIEVDLIEEVARVVGYERLPVSEALSVVIQEPQRSERAIRAVHRVLGASGFFEGVTFAFTTAKKAAPFLPAGLDTVSVSDDRRGLDNVLRPSVLSGLLDCRRVNQDAKVEAPGGLRLYELAGVFAQERPAGAPVGASIERMNLTLLADAPERDPLSGASLKAFDRKQLALRLMRGVVDALADELAGPGQLRVEPLSTPPTKGYDPAGCAGLTLGERRLGVMGLLADAVQKQWELHSPVVAAEIDAGVLCAGFPPRRLARALPAFPATQRDLSLIVAERTQWGVLEGIVTQTGLKWMEALQFVGVYRGQPIEPGKKSVTFRMTFRDDTRTLRDEEVNAEVDRLVSRMQAQAGAVVRTA